MDFFEAQARAKQRSSRLIVLFAFAVIGTIAAGYFAAWFFVDQAESARDRDDFAYQAYGENGQPIGRPLFDPLLLLMVTTGTLLVIGCSSFFKWMSFRQGGGAVAESVGGRRIDPGRATPAERRLLNVVEEMAIASGTPMPAVYVLDREQGINAFAAGLTTSDAVVAVTRGTLEKLSRDELQGVVGHEFSHILNGDMRLNVKLTALVFGILVIGLMGRGLLWSMRRVRGGKNSGGIVVAIFAVGLALLIIGYVGYFFGRLIQAAVSRQREFLADASAVQFTRNPQGIGGALRKIGGYALGSRLITNQATAIGHFFFAQGFRSQFGGAWATPPPLPERIRAVDPAWDGHFFDPPQVVDVAQESFATKGFAQPEGTSYAASPRGTPPRLPFQPQAVVADVGQLTEAHYAAAVGLLAAMPDTLLDAARQTATAPALVYGLINGAGAVDLVRRHDAGAGATFAALAPALAALAPDARLPLLLLAVPALRQLKAADMERFLGTLDELVHADARVSTFEFVLQKLLTHHLRLAQRPHGAPGYFSFVPLTGDIAAVLNALAHACASDEAAADRAYRAGTGQMPLIEKGLLDLPRQATDFAALDAALEKLAGASLPIKKRTLHAAAHVIGQDGTITVEEGELYRAIAAAIDCPLPPLATAA